MDKMQVVMLMLEKMNNDTRAMGVQSGIKLEDIEQQIITNDQPLKYMLSNIYDILVEKEVIKN